MVNNKDILLKVENVGVSVNGKSLVRGVSLEVKKGEIVTLIGPNGSGRFQSCWKSVKWTIN